MAIVNSWIIYNEIQKKRTPLFQVIVPLEEEMITEVKKTVSIQRLVQKVRSLRKRKLVSNVSLYLLFEGVSRKRCRRCRRCANNKKQNRTTTLYNERGFPLCKNCFLVYHMNFFSFFFFE